MTAPACLATIFAYGSQNLSYLGFLVLMTKPELYSYSPHGREPTDEDVSSRSSGLDTGQAASLGAGASREAAGTLVRDGLGAAAEPRSCLGC